MMNFTEAMKKIDYINRRFADKGMNPWYTWAIKHSWEKIDKWYKLLRAERWPIGSL